MSGFQQFGFGSNDDSIGRKSKKFKAEQGKTYRISFAWWDIVDGTLNVDAPTPKFVGAQRHYKEGVGYFLNKGPEYTKIAGEAPKQVIGTLIIVWPTDAKGEPDKVRLANGDFEVMPWIFSADKYKQFGQIHTEFPVGHHDLKLTCTDTQYQKMSFAPCKESILRKLLENPKAKSRTDEILARISDLSNNLSNEIARDLSLDEIQEKLAGGGASGGGFGKKSFGGGGGSGSAENIDDLVDGLLSG
jgi:hypothetical protein